METTEKEVRYLGEIRAVDDESGEKWIEGYAIIFNSLSQNLGGFYEIVNPVAIDNDVLKASDIYAYINHNENSGVLARSRYGVGSLQLSIDDKGLKYRFRLGKSYHHQQLLEYIERGEVIGSSFAFTVEDEVWERRPDGDYLRTILKFRRIYDISPVFEPAYLSTDVVVAQRSLDKLDSLKEQEKKAEQEKEELKNYFENLKNTYKYDS